MVVSTDIECVILAAGTGSRMLDLTGGGPKCMLPLAGPPLLYHSLKLLENNGFKSAIVTVPDNIKSDVVKFSDKYKLPIKLDVVGVPMQEEWGTLDTLRNIQDKLSSREILVLSVDLITNVNIKTLVDFHRSKSAGLTVLLNKPVSDVKSRITPGSKTNKYKLERDLIGLSKNNNSICLFQAEADVESVVHIPSRVLNKQSTFTIHSNYLDAHLYIINRSNLDEHIKNVAMTTVKGELIPKLVYSQFKTTNKEENEDTDKRQEYSLKDDSPRQACYAMVTELPTLRVNNIPNYWQAFKLIKNGDLLSNHSLNQYQDSSASVDAKCHMDNCYVGPKSKIDSKTTLKSSSIGANVVVNEKVKIINSVIMDNVTICSNVSITDSVIAEGATIKPGCELNLAIIGKQCNLAEGSNITNQVLLDSDSMMSV